MSYPLDDEPFFIKILFFINININKKYIYIFLFICFKEMGRAGFEPA